ncbi:hypothetical protein E4656_14960 [Natronospirillum operosum]|uniref:DUF1127 domain-containing protein n=1 Tax=Natronospirillum operosum TaxID=2759953 RepID=A0A4Z0W6D2_9GAMM|nr:hypothetical protein [Natronospirillum operosum]TGG91693.1 hypothetical protein E4656_14960 [Natronospirillum operosum]
MVTKQNTTSAAESFTGCVRATIREWHRRHNIRSRLRTELQEMDIARTEQDTGLTTGDLLREATKPFWKA